MYLIYQFPGQTLEAITKLIKVVHYLVCLLLLLFFHVVESKKRFSTLSQQQAKFFHIIQKDKRWNSMINM